MHSLSIKQHQELFQYFLPGLPLVESCLLNIRRMDNSMSNNNINSVHLIQSLEHLWTVKQQETFVPHKRQAMVIPNA